MEDAKEAETGVLASSESRNCFALRLRLLLLLLLSQFLLYFRF